MNLDEILFGILVLASPALFAVAGILTVAALQRPRILFLTATSILTWLIALGVLADVAAVANNALGLPLSLEVVRTVFRAILVAIAVFPFWWTFLFLTGRFDDRPRPRKP